MASSDVYLTKEGFKKLKEELAKLNRQKNDLSREIGEAREQGDLRENAGYAAARDKQRFVLGRIEEIQAKIGNARIVDAVAVNRDEIRLGATVTLIDEASKNQVVYTLSSADAADPGLGRISVDSPLAQGLLGAKAGAKVRVKLPGGEKAFEIVRVEYK
ncbi:MAG: transcription elongation factor GreA [Elusimicrobia bacterium]|nr:transcription elongation factor GreA [Elusimicrobiota bacterium]